jgi:seryl-tRNA synthetase
MQVELESLERRRNEISNHLCDLMDMEDMDAETQKRFNSLRQSRKGVDEKIKSLKDNLANKPIPSSRSRCDLISFKVKIISL